MKYSIVIPVHNEEGNIAGLIEEIRAVMKSLESTFEIIVVDDGSTDETRKELEKTRTRGLETRGSVFKTITFRKNFGQSSALDAGIKEASGSLIITLDGDGQNDPSDIPNLYKKLEEGYDVVCGWRYRRKDSWSKLFISRVAGGMRSILVDDKVHDAGCTLRIYRKECFDDLELSGEMHRMLPAVLRWRGFRITEVKVNHRPRTAGVSKYGLDRTVKGFLDMLLMWFTRKYSNRPLHFFGSVGLLLVSISTALLIVLAFMKMFYNYTLSDKIWPLVGMIGFVTGIQLFVSGVLADLITKNSTRGKSWMIKDVVENK